MPNFSSNRDKEGTSLFSAFLVLIAWIELNWICFTAYTTRFGLRLYTQKCYWGVRMHSLYFWPCLYAVYTGVTLHFPYLVSAVWGVVLVFGSWYTLVMDLSMIMYNMCLLLMQVFTNIVCLLLAQKRLSFIPFSRCSVHRARNSLLTWPSFTRKQRNQARSLKWCLPVLTAVKKSSRSTLELCPGGPFPTTINAKKPSPKSMMLKVRRDSKM